MKTIWKKKPGRQATVDRARSRTGARAWSEADDATERAWEPLILGETIYGPGGIDFSRDERKVSFR